MLPYVKLDIFQDTPEALGELVWPALVTSCPRAAAATGGDQLTIPGGFFPPGVVVRRRRQ